MSDTIQCIHDLTQRYAKAFGHRPLYLRLAPNVYRALVQQLADAGLSASLRKPQLPRDMFPLVTALVDTLQRHTPGVQYRGHYANMLVLTVPRAASPVVVSNHILTIPTAPDAYTERRLASNCIPKEESPNGASQATVAAGGALA